MKEIYLFSVAALLFVQNCLAGRGQLIGEMKEVDEDNNVVGDQPFFGSTFSAPKTEKATAIRSIIMWILAILVIGLLIYAALKIFRSITGAKDSKTKQSSRDKKSSSSFQLFKDDDETGKTRNLSKENTGSSIGNFLGITEEKKEPPKRKGFGTKVKSFFGIGKKNEGTK